MKGFNKKIISEDKIPYLFLLFYLSDCSQKTPEYSLQKLAEFAQDLKQNICRVFLITTVAREDKKF